MFITFIFQYFIQNNSSILGGGAKNCEKGIEDPEGEGEAGHQELKWETERLTMQKGFFYYVMLEWNFDWDFD